MASIEVYSTLMCPYCIAAKNLLKAKGAEFKEIDLTDKPEERAALVKKSNGLRTVPQIFINGKHIGGFDRLSELDQAGELDKLLQS